MNKRLERLEGADTLRSRAWAWRNWLRDLERDRVTWN